MTKLAPIRSALIMLAGMLLAIYSGAPLLAGAPCQAIVIDPVAAVENSDSILERDDILTGISQYRLNKRTGLAEFCSHGGYCYPADNVKVGNPVEALHLLNCSIGPKKDEDDDYEYFSLKLIRLIMTTESKLRHNLLDQLGELGLCNACADNVANYINLQPNSRCAHLAKKALEGNQKATSTLVSNPEYCVWKY